MNKPLIDQLVDRFLACPLPESVKVDPCAMPEIVPYPYERTGTNLLTAVEAKQLLERVLGDLLLGRTPQREGVYLAIDGERDFQDQKWGTIEEHPHEMGSWILIMESLLSAARKAWQSVNGDEKAADELRKVTAVGVACLEQHGVVHRYPSGCPGWELKN